MSITSPITTHVLDTSIGRPACGMQFELARQISADRWEVIGKGATSAQGRSGDLEIDAPLSAGVYRLTFATGAYFESRGVATFYPTVTIEFSIVAPLERYHVPLIVGPFGYSTYRGS